MHRVRGKGWVEELTVRDIGLERFAVRVKKTHADSSTNPVIAAVRLVCFNLDLEACELRAFEQFPNRRLFHAVLLVDFPPLQHEREASIGKCQVRGH